MKKKKIYSKKKKKKIKKEKPKEESEIEEEIKEAEKEIEKKDIIEREGIKEFLLPTEVKAPVLERIAIQRPIEEPPIIPEIDLTEKSGRERRIDYSSVSNEPKYTSEIGRGEEKKYETTFIPPVLTRREISNREDFFRPREDTWGEAKQISETPQQFEIMDTTGRRLPFEEEQKKYKKVKF